MHLFEPITLQEMESAKLMNRVDTKFIFHVKLLDEILINSTSHYKIVCIQNRQYSNYRTMYYDTAKYALYHDHHAGKLDRCKIRLRTYQDDQLSFLEVKLKNNKGFTQKKRIKYADTFLDERACSFISKETFVNAKELKESMQVSYQRITLINNLVSERVTIDVGLKINQGNNERSFDNLVIMEVKQNKTKASSFVQRMKDLKINQETISKYCVGVSHLVADVKKNNFKETNIKINKLIHL